MNTGIKMAALANAHKTFIVIRLACYDTPTEVQTQFNEEYGSKPSLSQIAYYNADGVHADEKLADKWKNLFKETRKRFNEEIALIPIANQAYRLKKLQRNMENLERMKNYAGANATIEQAAKEVGGSFTNKKEVSLDGLLGSIDMNALTDEQLNRIANGEHPVAVLANESEGPIGDST